MVNMIFCSSPMRGSSDADDLGEQLRSQGAIGIACQKGLITPGNEEYGILAVLYVRGN